MTGVELACAVGLLVVLPHVVPLRSATPATAAATWLAALLLRALVAVAAALYAFVYLPQTGILAAIAGACWHAVLPLLTADLEVSGHPLADAAALLPALALAVSLLWLMLGIARAALSLRRWLTRRGHWAGPDGATIVDASEVLVAVNRVGRPRVLVSRGALSLLDRDELAASIAHEWSHVRRRHRPLLVAASLLAALGRPLPGTGTAEAELVLALERDADEAAVLATGKRLALAGAICKVALSAPAPSPALAALGGAPVAARLDPLLDGPTRYVRSVEVVARGVALTLVLSVMALASCLPAWVAAAAGGHPPGSVAGCPHEER